MPACAGVRSRLRPLQSAQAATRFVHEVAPPREDPHLHLDVRFLVVAPPGAALAGNHESEAIRWVRWDELAGYEPDDGLLRLAAAARERFRRLPR